MLARRARRALSMARVDALLVTSESDCPSPDAVQAEVRELTTPEQRRGVPPDAKVFITDQGESIAVAITRDGQTTVRVYRDAARDCSRRAHFVSVLVVVSLMPPDLGSASSEPEAPAPPPTPPPEPRPPAEPPPPASPPPSPRSPSSPSRVRIELSARGDVSVPISDSVRAALPSGALGVALGAGDVRLLLATAYTPSKLLRYTASTAGSAELQRFEGLLGARAVLTHTPLDASVDVGLLLVRQELLGRSSHQPRRDTAFSAGGRLGLHFCWSEQSLVSPFFGAYASVFPFAPAISQLPQGTVGHLPYLWLGLSGGLALAL